MIHHSAARCVSLASTPSALGCAMVLVVALALAGCGKKTEGADSAPPSVTVAQPVTRTVTDWDEFTGRFDAIEQVQIRARVTGFVTSVEFKDGAMVKAGDLLYVIDPRQYQAAALQAKGQFADGQAKVELAQRELVRAQTLIKTDAISESVVDQRTQQSSAAQAATITAQGVQQRADLDVEFTKIRAPIAGRISRHLVTVGNLVQGSETGATLLTSIVSLDPIHIYFDMDETTYLRNNSLWFAGKRPSSRDTPNPVQIELGDEAKPSHKGTMDFLDNRMDVGTGTLRARGVVPNPDLSILPGQFGRIRVIGSAPYAALLIPEGAVATDQSRKIVFVVNDNDTVEAKEVMLGPLDDGLLVVRDGLDPKDRVIVEGLQRVRVGAKVAPHTVDKVAGARP